MSLFALCDARANVDAVCGCLCVCRIVCDSLFILCAHVMSRWRSRAWRWNSCGGISFRFHCMIIELIFFCLLSSSLSRWCPTAYAYATAEQWTQTLNWTKTFCYKTTTSPELSSGVPYTQFIFSPRISRRSHRIAPPSRAGLGILIYLFVCICRSSVSDLYFVSSVARMKTENWKINELASHNDVVVVVVVNAWT